MKRQLPEVVSGGRFVSGGELEAVQGEPQTPDELKLAVIALLQPGETVTRALKRLRPARPQAGAKRGRGGGRGRGAHTDADAFLKALEPASDEGASDEARNHAMFDKLTEHASALLDLGFDDIYQDCREKLEASIQGRPNGGFIRGKSVFVWHDAPSGHEGAHEQRQRENDDITFAPQPKPVAAAAPASTPAPVSPAAPAAAGVAAPAAGAAGDGDSARSVGHTLASPTTVEVSLPKASARPAGREGEEYREDGAGDDEALRTRLELEAQAQRAQQDGAEAARQNAELWRARAAQQAAWAAQSQYPQQQGGYPQGGSYWPQQHWPQQHWHQPWQPPSLHGQQPWQPPPYGQPPWQPALAHGQWSQPYGWQPQAAAAAEHDPPN